MLKTSNLSVAKIVTTPTLSSWSQAYNAGSLFAVLSLKEDSPDNQESLSSLGKKTFDVLEQEYFTLETKNLASIKQAVNTTLNNLTPEILDSLLVVSITENVVYLFAAGMGKILLKRGETLTSILDCAKELTSASGTLNNNDILIMETGSFANIISNSALLSSFDHIPMSELAETLTPKIHEKEDANACAMFLEYQTQENVADEENNVLESSKPQTETKRKFSLPVIKNPLHKLSLTHSKKILLTVTVIIAAIFLLSLHFAQQKRQEEAMNNLFQKVYVPAKQKYDEGKGLKGLNKNIARSDFQSAQKILSENVSKFPKNSQDAKKISDLLKNVNKELEAYSPAKIAANLDRSKITVVVENGSGVEGAAGKAADFLKSKGYKISSTGNADNYKYTGVTIKTKNSTKAYIDLLKKDLSQNYTVTNTSSDLPNNSSFDVLIIIGK